jgi:hypothetical protein
MTDHVFTAIKPNGKREVVTFYQVTRTQARRIAERWAERAGYEIEPEPAEGEAA